MRLFLGAFANIELYDEIQEDFSQYFEGKWVERKNIHSTIYFFGNRDIDDIERLLSEIDLKRLKEAPKLKGLKLMKKRYNSILYTSYHSRRFEYINKRISKALDQKVREFLPHVTLLRVKEILDYEYQELLKKYEDSVIGKLQTNVCLISSTLTDKGPVYKIVKKF